MLTLLFYSFRIYKNMAEFNSDQLLSLFTQYAMKEGSKQLLSMDGLKSLIQSHFSNVLVSLSKLDCQLH